MGPGYWLKMRLSVAPGRSFLGLGGSGTVDGGAGILRALGYRFWAADGQGLAMTGADLSRVAKMSDLDMCCHN